MKKRKSIEKSRRRGYQVSLKVLHSLLDSQLWKRLGLRVHFLDKDVMRVFSAHFTSGGAGSSAEGAGHGSTEANAVLNTPAEFDALHENRDAGDKEAVTPDAPCVLCGHVVCVLAGAEHSMTKTSSDTAGSVTATTERHGDSMPAVDRRNRMWRCPVPSCHASSHLYCMAERHLTGVMRGKADARKDHRTVDGNNSYDEEGAMLKKASKSLVPVRVTCSACGGSSAWADVVRAVCVKQEDKEGAKGKRKATELSSLPRGCAGDDGGSSDEDSDNDLVAAHNVSGKGASKRHDRGKKMGGSKEAVIDLGSDSNEDEDEAVGDILFIDDTSDDEDDVFMTST